MGALGSGNSTRRAACPLSSSGKSSNAAQGSDTSAAVCGDCASQRGVNRIGITGFSIVEILSFACAGDHLGHHSGRSCTTRFLRQTLTLQTLRAFPRAAQALAAPGAGRWGGKSSARKFRGRGRGGLRKKRKLDPRRVARPRKDLFPAVSIHRVFGSMRRVRSRRFWISCALSNKGHAPGPFVMICPFSVHAPGPVRAFSHFL